MWCGVVCRHVRVVVREWCRGGVVPDGLICAVWLRFVPFWLRLQVWWFQPRTLAIDHTISHTERTQRLRMMLSTVRWPEQGFQRTQLEGVEWRSEQGFQRTQLQGVERWSEQGYAPRRCIVSACTPFTSTYRPFAASSGHNSKASSINAASAGGQSKASSGGNGHGSSVNAASAGGHSSAGTVLLTHTPASAVTTCSLAPWPRLYECRLRWRADPVFCWRTDAVIRRWSDAVVRWHALIGRE